jgi:hypothetical protein
VILGERGRGRGHTPVRGTGAPVRGTGAPVRGTGAPVRGTSAPVRGTGAPVRGKCNERNPTSMSPLPPPPTPQMSCSIFNDHRPGRGTGDAVRGTGDAVRGTGDAVRGTGDAVRGTGGSGRGSGHGTGRGTVDKSRTSLAPESGRIYILVAVHVFCPSGSGYISSKYGS